MRMHPDQPTPATNRRPQRIFVWVLPLLWTATSLCATQYHGDEYGLWLGGSIAGAWIAFLLPNGLHVNTLMFAAILAGAPLIGLIGWGMDAVRVRWWLWLPLWLIVATALAASMLVQYPSLARAIAKNGSILAYALCASNLSLMLNSFVLLPGFAAASLWRRYTQTLPGCCRMCRYDLTGNASGRCPEVRHSRRHARIPIKPAQIRPN